MNNTPDPNPQPPPLPADHFVSEQADEPMPDAPPASHDFSKEAMIIEPPEFQFKIPSTRDVQSKRYWNNLWFNIGRPITILGLWLGGALLVTHVALNWNDLPSGVLEIAAAATVLLLLAAIAQRYFPRKARKKTEHTHGGEVSAFFGTNLEAHRQLRHSNRVDVYFDGSRVGLVSEKQTQITFGTLPFSTKKPDGRPLRAQNPEGIKQARDAGMPLPEEK